jgi:hypothetical protein
MVVVVILAEAVTQVLQEALEGVEEEGVEL